MRVLIVEDDPYMAEAIRDGPRLDGVRRLVDGLELLALDEEGQDGNSFLGPKHWHVFDAIARQPPAQNG